MTGHFATQRARPRCQQVIKTFANKLKNSSGTSARALKDATLYLPAALARPTCRSPITMLVPRPSVSPLGHGLPSPWPLPHLPASLGFALGFVAGAVTTIVAAMVGASHDPAVGLLLLTAAAAMVGALTTPIGALASALQCWAFYIGFLLNRQGVLTFDHSSRTALAIIVFAGVVPSLLLTAARFAQWHGHTYKPLIK